VIRSECAPLSLSLPLSLFLTLSFSLALSPYLRLVHLFSFARSFRFSLDDSSARKLSSNLTLSSGNEDSIGFSLMSHPRGDLPTVEQLMTKIHGTGPTMKIRRTLSLSQDGLRGGSKMKRKTQNGVELLVHMYMHTHTHAHVHLHTNRHTHVDTRVDLARARARARFLHVNGRCDSNSVRNISSNGTDISIRTSTGSVAPVRRSIRTSIRLSVRPFALAWLERCRQALASSSASWLGASIFTMG